MYTVKVNPCPSFAVLLCFLFPSVLQWIIFHYCFILFHMSEILCLSCSKVFFFIISLFIINWFSISIFSILSVEYAPFICKSTLEVVGTFFFYLFFILDQNLQIENLTFQKHKHGSLWTVLTCRQQQLHTSRSEHKHLQLGPPSPQRGRHIKQREHSLNKFCCRSRRGRL